MKILDLAYFSALASDFASSDTSTDVDSDSVSVMHALTLLHASIMLSFMTGERARDAHRAFFKVPPKYKGQKPILFGRVESEPMNHGAQMMVLILHNSFIMDRSHTA